MSKALILNGHQAKAVVDAMCALNNVSGRARFYFDELRVVQTTDGAVLVMTEHDAESYDNQGEFFSAYSELMDAAS